jgi:hypothetical protein
MNRSGSPVVRGVFELKKCAVPQRVAEGDLAITASNVMQKENQRT